MAKEAVFTLTLESELLAAFLAEAEGAHRPASQIVRELMREFVERQHQARKHEAFLQQKVDTARASVRAGCGRSNEEVEAEFVARRTSTEGGCDGSLETRDLAGPS